MNKKRGSENGWAASSDLGSQALSLKPVGKLAKHQDVAQMSLYVLFIEA